MPDFVFILFFFYFPPPPRPPDFFCLFYIFCFPPPFFSPARPGAGNDAEIVGRVVTAHQCLLPALLSRLTDVCLGEAAGGSAGKEEGVEGGGEGASYTRVSLSGWCVEDAEDGAEALHAVLGTRCVRAVLGQGGAGMVVLTACMLRLEGGGGKLKGGACVSFRALERLRTQHGMLAAVVEAGGH